MRYTELDGLRGIAALSVYFSHLLGVFDFNSTIFDYISNSPFHILWHGESAVNLFFLLSGFVLTLPYIKYKESLNLLPFYIKRVFRIYPAFITAILFSIFLQFYLFNPNNIAVYSNWINEFWKWNLKDISLSQITNTFILAGLPFNTKLFNPVIGTLRTEMIVSMVLPFLIFVALRVKVLINLIILFFLFFIGKDVLSIFYLGIIIAIYLVEVLDFLKFLDKKVYSLISIVLACYLYTSRFSLNFIFPIYNKVTFLLSILGCLSFLLIVLRNGILTKFMKTKYSQFLGNISYSLYLFHFPILLVVCSCNFNVYLIFPISFGLTLAISYIVYKYVELPFMRMGKTVANYV